MKKKQHILQICNAQDTCLGHFFVLALSQFVLISLSLVAVVVGAYSRPPLVVYLVVVVDLLIAGRSVKVLTPKKIQLVSIVIEMNKKMTH